MEEATWSALAGSIMRKLIESYDNGSGGHLVLIEGEGKAGKSQLALDFLGRLNDWPSEYPIPTVIDSLHLYTDDDVLSKLGDVLANGEPVVATVDVGCLPGDARDTAVARVIGRANAARPSCRFEAALLRLRCGRSDQSSHYQWARISVLPGCVGFEIADVETC